MKWETQEEEKAHLRVVVDVGCLNCKYVFLLKKGKQICSFGHDFTHFPFT